MLVLTIQSGPRPPRLHIPGLYDAHVAFPPLHSRCLVIPFYGYRYRQSVFTPYDARISIHALFFYLAVRGKTRCIRCSLIE